ncbi:glycosyltransferase family 4 protein [Luteolibacter sp. Populi]|uniref:glycosyltransferase family 4 protein n=1 Tax=Luteolibacter sp. Populi TaxID=3230487 RepID=UPI0034651008
MAVPLPQPQILVAHPWMGRGGSEATAMWTLHALQDVARITFTSASPVDFDSLNRVYGTRVSPSRVEFLQAPRFPWVETGTKFAFWQRAWFERFCSRVGGRFDACISAYNPIRFSRPAIQLIGDFSFSEECRLELYPTASEQAHHRPSLVRKLYLSVGEQLAGRENPESIGAGDCVVANSRWTAGILGKHFQLTDPPILYPPAAKHPGGGAGERDPLAFVCMGRIMPEKELETIIVILDKVRAAGHPVTLDLAGQFGPDPYSRRIREMAEERRDWIDLVGFLDPKKKSEMFATRSYGIHACRVEAFGIAVAEMAAAGLIPFVPAHGGVPEIVGRDELIFADEDDAAAKICAQLADRSGDVALRAGLQARVAGFWPECFAENLLGIVGNFLGRPLADTATP